MITVDLLSLITISPMFPMFPQDKRYITRLYLNSSLICIICHNISEFLHVVQKIAKI